MSKKNYFKNDCYNCLHFESDSELCYLDAINPVDAIDASSEKDCFEVHAWVAKERVEKLEKQNKELIDCLKSIEETDITDRPPDVLWLTNWRNTAKLKAREVLAKIKGE